MRADYCPMAGEPCQSMCEIPCGQRKNIHAVVPPIGQALVDGGFTEGEPPENARAAWLLMRCINYETGGFHHYPVLAVNVCGEGWCEAVDWRLDSYRDSVHIEGDVIAGWIAYSVPSALFKAL